MSKSLHHNQFHNELLKVVSRTVTALSGWKIYTFSIGYVFICVKLFELLCVLYHAYIEKMLKILYMILKGRVCRHDAPRHDCTVSCCSLYCKHTQLLQLCLHIFLILSPSKCYTRLHQRSWQKMQITSLARAFESCLYVTALTILNSQEQILYFLY